MAVKIPVEALIEAFNYDPLTGLLTFKVKRGKKRRGDIAGCVNGNGYIVVGFRWKGKDHLIYAHRIIMAMVVGSWPSGHIDHRNGVEGDNRWENLREASHSESQHNKALSEFVGTIQYGNRWQARICVGKKVHYLGIFAAREEAHEAYLEARKALVPFQPIPRRA